MIHISRVIVEQVEVSFQSLASFRNVMSPLDQMDENGIYQINHRTGNYDISNSTRQQPQLKRLFLLKNYSHYY